ncbi:MAG: AmmeMemoRadiSam system protein B [Bacteroidota bacterium]|nr:AmmeMemoRadiSam system protein B [Bacteroidota bacterium]
MKNFDLFWLLILTAVSVVTSCLSQQKDIDRQPAVAGQFYPSNPDELRSTLKGLFSKAIPSKNLTDIIGIISPHAGYVFSGVVAASAFNQVDPSKIYENIFILASSHYIGFEGASIYDQGDYITPLGKVKVNKQLVEQLIKKYDFFSNRTDAHAREHSLEVQLPFLQYVLKKDFQIIPIVIGTQNSETCRKIAGALKHYLNPNNLFVISTDYSHYPTYDDAVKVDKVTADAIVSNSPEKLLAAMNANELKGISNLSTSLCGWTSVLTLLYMTQGSENISFTPIQYKNSGDSKYGEKARVVGYNAIAISLKEKKAQFSLSEKDKKDLLAIARNTVAQYVKERKVPDVDATKLSDNIKTHCGAFVTLHKHGELRGCIGRFEPTEPLYKVVQQMAVAASTEDYRFQSVKSNEIKDLDIEISVLTPMKKINSIDEIELGKHGIYIKKGNRGGTFLPQVAKETGWTREEFLGHCAQDKAGIGWDGWKDADIFIYEALVFSEK